MIKRWQSTRSNDPCNDSEVHDGHGATSHGEASNQMLSAAIQQSDTATANSMVDLALRLLRHKRANLAWECYMDLSDRHLLRHVSADQFQQLIKLFSLHTNEQHGLNYILTLVEDMKRLGYSVARRDKLMVMQLLGKSGLLQEMEKVFDDLDVPLGKESAGPADPLTLLKKDNRQASRPASTMSDGHKPFDIMLGAYQQHLETVGKQRLLSRSLAIYGDMLDLGIPASPATTRLLIANIRLAGTTLDVVEQVWKWAWQKMGQHVGGPTLDLDPLLHRELVMYFAAAGRPEYGLAVNDIMAQKHMPRDRRMMVSLIHKIGRAGDIPRSLALLDEMEQLGLAPDLVTYNALLDIHAHQLPRPDVATLVEIYDTMQKEAITPDVYTYGTMMLLCATQGNLPLIRQFYKDMVRHHIQPDNYIYSAMMQCFLVHNDRATATKVLSQNSQSLEMHNLMIKSLIKSKQPDHAHQLLDWMIDTKSLVVDEFSFGPLLSHYADLADVDKVRGLMTRMRQLGVPVTTYSHTTLLEAYVKAGDLELAEDMLDTEIAPNSHAYNTLLNGYVRRNDTDKVYGTYKHMLKSGIKMTEHTYGILMKFYGRRGDFVAVETLMETMQANGITPGPVCWTTLLQSYVTQQDYDNAKQVIQAMVDVDQQPTWTTWTSLMHGMVRQGETSLAYDLLPNIIKQQQRAILRVSREMDKHFLKADYSPLASVADGRLSDDEEYISGLPSIIDDLLDGASTSKRMSPSAWVNELFSGQHVQSHQVDDTPSYQASTTPPPHLFTSLIRGFTLDQQFDKARQVVKDMQNHGSPFSLPVYTALLTLSDRDGQYGDVDALFEGLLNPLTPEAVEAGATHPDLTLHGLNPIPWPVLPPKKPIQPSAHQDQPLDRLAEQSTGHQTTAKPFVSQFALSIYLDSLTRQERWDDIDDLWGTLSKKCYHFDIHNWNRYVVSLARGNELEEACQVAYDQFLSPSAPPTEARKRPSDRFSLSNHPMHRRTSLALAQAMKIQGCFGMGEARLRSVVIDHIHLVLKS
ncbi:hypothetical protein DM01DRAFT_1348188 [Hesseltinella vesiculosa]|uniref:Uncharacterized protein n=1 Tax=Hesseltinella vesiculosa TaxID=101127 RepID=A0A1X2G9M2_9FUNG|nr:hypothetical protein DM01DRAFT_1348188 [Hesseltinella vesiculosa]